MAKEGFAPLQSRFHERDVLRGLAVHTSDGVEGVAVGVDTAGALQIETTSGKVRILSSEVSVRPAELYENT